MNSPLHTLSASLRGTGGVAAPTEIASEEDWTAPPDSCVSGELTEKLAVCPVSPGLVARVAAVGVSLVGENVPTVDSAEAPGIRPKVGDELAALVGGWVCSTTPAISSPVIQIIPG